jgi:hypothetical protein
MELKIKKANRITLIKRINTSLDIEFRNLDGKDFLETIDYPLINNLFTALDALDDKGILRVCGPYLSEDSKTITIELDTYN